MKTFLLAVGTTLTLSFAANAQVADNCAMVHQVLTDLQKDSQLMSYRGREIWGGNYESKVTFAGFSRASVLIGDFSNSLVAETVPTAKKEDALKVYNGYLEQLKACLKKDGFKTETSGTDYVTETVFADPRPTHLTVSVGFFEMGGQYVVTMTVRKIKGTPSAKTR